MTLDLHIKTVCIHVSEHTPINVVWSRGKKPAIAKTAPNPLGAGNKKAKTKSRLLNENVATAVIDEKFQVLTQMELKDGRPIKDKMVSLSQIPLSAPNFLQSKLQIMGDKGRGFLGEADLNLAEYHEDEFKYMKLPLRKCDDTEAFIEVGIRATPAPNKDMAQRASTLTEGGVP